MPSIEHFTILQFTNKTKKCLQMRKLMRTHRIMRNERSENREYAQRHYYIVRSLSSLAEGYKQLNLI